MSLLLTRYSFQFYYFWNVYLVSNSNYMYLPNTCKPSFKAPKMYILKRKLISSNCEFPAMTIFILLGAVRWPDIQSSYMIYQTNSIQYLQALRYIAQFHFLFYFDCIKLLFGYVLFMTTCKQGHCEMALFQIHTNTGWFYLASLLWTLMKSFQINIFRSLVFCKVFCQVFEVLSHIFLLKLRCMSVFLVLFLV